MLFNSIITSKQSFLSLHKPWQYTRKTFTPNINLFICISSSNQFILINKLNSFKFINQAVTSKDPQINSHNGTQNTILGLLAKGDMSCAGAVINDNLFGEEEKPEEGANRPPKKTGDTTGTGVVKTAEEKRRIEEEEKKKKEQEEEEKRKAAEEEAERQAAEKREKSLVHKGIRFFKNFLKDAITEEE